MNKTIIFLVAIISINCTNTMKTTDKLSFTGDKKLLEELKVNIRFSTGEESHFFTIFEKGKKFDYDNEEVMIYEVFVNHKNKLFAYTTFDDVERALGFEASKTEFFFMKINGDIYFARSKTDKTTMLKNGTKLLPFKECKMLNPSIDKSNFIDTIIP